MNKITFITFLFISGITFSQDSISVLFIGNSYTYVNDLPTVFSNLTISLGDEVTVDSKTNGGYTFQNHLDDPITHAKIKSKPWDFVLIQGQSQEPSFPTDQVNAVTLPPAVSIADSIYANWYCSQAMYFMTWGRQVGDPQWDSINTFDKMNLRLRNAYVRISDSAEASVAPVGVAWKYIRDMYPGINLYSADGSHPSSEGSYLAACTIYASVFRKSPVGASYLFGLDPTTAGILQQAAELSVLDSLQTWHIRAKEDLSIAAFQLTQNGEEILLENDSWHSTGYEWDFGDGTGSTLENTSHLYTANGSYLIRLIALSECGNDTSYQTVTISSLAVDNQNHEKIIKKSLGSGQFELIITGSIDESNIQLIDLSGRSLPINNLVFIEGNSMRINLMDQPFGVYYIKFQMNQIVVVTELVKIN